MENRVARKQKTVSDIVEEAIVDICDNYCKYPAIYDIREDSDEELKKMMREQCYSCLLNRL